MGLVLVDILRWSGCQNPEVGSLVVVKAVFVDLDFDARPGKAFGTEDDVALLVSIRPALYTHSPNKRSLQKMRNRRNPSFCVCLSRVSLRISIRTFNKLRHLWLELGNRLGIPRVLKSALGLAQFEGSLMFDTGADLPDRISFPPLDISEPHANSGLIHSAAFRIKRPPLPRQLKSSKRLNRHIANFYMNLKADLTSK